MGNARRRAPLLALAAITAALALPAAAQATVVTLNQDEGGLGINFAAGNPSLSPGDVYPSVIAAPEGTVNDVNVHLQVNHDHVDDLDIALVSPNDTAVHLMSDACGDDDGFNNFNFDDFEPDNFLSNLGPCDATFTYDPSNYDGDDGPGTETDVYSAPGPDGASTLNELSFFTGGPSGGSWRLFAMDDTTLNGGAITTWSITLDYTPTPVTTPPVTTPPGNPTSPINPAGNIRQRKCKKKQKTTPKSAESAKKKKCKKKKKV
jgi:subtilisin-like proprotein convertase family protein